MKTTKQSLGLRKTFQSLKHYPIRVSFLFSLLFFSLNAQYQSDDLLEQPKTIGLKTFKTLSVNSGIVLNLIPSDKNKMIVYGDRYNSVVIKEKGETLKINIRFSELIHFDQPFVDLYYSEQLENIKLHQGSVVEAVRPIKTSQLLLKAHEGSQFTGEIKANFLNSKVHTGSFLKLSGHVQNHLLKVRTGGVCLSKDLITEQTIVNASTGGDGIIYSEKEVFAKVVLGGYISISGNPKKINASRLFGGEILDSRYVNNAKIKRYNFKHQQRKN